MNLVLIQGCRFGEAALSRGDLTEVEWRILRMLLPVERKPEKRGRGRPPADNRNIINGILWRLRTGAPWRDVPENTGNGIRRWSACDVWESVAITLAETMAESGHYELDSTTVRAHVSAAGGKEGFINETLGRARGGFTSKIKPPAPEVFRARIRRVAGCATPTGYAGVTADAIRR